MKVLKLAVAVGMAALLLTGATLAAQKAPAKNLTCCEKAAAEGKQCSHKCCVAAHREGKSCEKCNPGQQDLKILKKKATARKS